MKGYVIKLYKEHLKVQEGLVGYEFLEGDKDLKRYMCNIPEGYSLVIDRLKIRSKFKTRRRNGKE